MDSDNTYKERIQGIYAVFSSKMVSILSKRKELIKTYRSKIEQAKIKEISDSFNNQEK